MGVALLGEALELSITLGVKVDWQNGGKESFYFYFFTVSLGDTVLVPMLGCGDAAADFVVGNDSRVLSANERLRAGFGARAHEAAVVDMLVPPFELLS